MNDTLSFREPDGLPIDLGSTRSSGINAIAYHRLCKSLGIKEQTRVFDVRQYLALVSSPVLSWACGALTPLFPLRPAAGLAINRWKSHGMPNLTDPLVPADFEPERQKDGSSLLRGKEGVERLRRAAEGLYFEDFNPPFADVTSPSTFEALHTGVSAARDSDNLEWVAAEAQRLDSSDMAVVLTTPISFFERGIKDFGYEEWLVKVMTEVGVVNAYLDLIEHEYVDLLETWSEVIKGDPEAILVSDDLGSQQGPLISPEVYRELFKPRHEGIVSTIRKMFPASKVLLHCCGSIREMIPDLIEAGFDALNPIQIAARGMDPGELKREFGRDIAFWGGGIDTQHTLVNGTPDEVCDETRRLIETLAPGGGFVFSAVHNIQADVPAANIVALFETASEYC